MMDASRKSFIRDLQALSRPRKVWVQALLLSIHNGGQQLVVDDGTASLMVEVESTERRAALWTTLGAGDYLLLQGELASISDRPKHGPEEGQRVEYLVLRALIVHVLADPNLETLWTLELLKQQRRQQQPQQQQQQIQQIQIQIQQQQQQQQPLPPPPPPPPPQQGNAVEEF
jgi:hypothetical protein